MSEHMLGHYKILSLLGRGGMGEVHRAQDTKLGREVALKILPDDFARDPERLARFRREAKVLASLQHPNIAGIFGLEEDSGRVFLAMELAEGTDLTDRIAQGPIPEEEVVDIARQLAAGLEEAHEKGVVHRDLKPANIKLGSDGKVKILDFGLARAFSGEPAGEENLENSPTITAATSRGIILGTAAYMSPEQARGKTVDRRADIWAYGVVLFEMLTGERLFEGETVSDTLAAVLRAEIVRDHLPADTSPGMRRLLERCLERDPLRRLRDIGEARVFLEEGAQNPSLLASASDILGADGFPGEAGARRGFPLWATIGIAAVVAVAGVFVGWQVLGRTEPPPVYNTALPTPDGTVFNLRTSRPGPAAISPDGSMVAYAGRDETGAVALYLRRLDSPEATSMSGTDGAAYPFWSPDSRYIGFFSNAEGKVKKVAVSGGPPVSLCDASNMKGGTWNAEGVILFAPDHQSGIHRVSASGGASVAITTLNGEENENSHRHPRFLPDGRHFLYLARIPGSKGENLVYLGTLDGEAPRVVATSETEAEYSDGHLLTVREGILLATPFDLGSNTVAGDAVPLVENVLRVTGAAYGLYTSTVDGMLAYMISRGSTELALEWAGPDGAQLGRVGEPDDFRRPRVSPDGTQAVVEILDSENDSSDLWLVDLGTGLRSRFTFDPGNELSAVWSPDGSTIFYTAEVDSTEQILMQPVEGTGGVTMLHEDDLNVALTGTSPDGATLMVSRDDPETTWNLYSLDVATAELSPMLVTDAAVFTAVISPDGRWYAYTYVARGGFEIIVRPMAGGERRWQVDKGGGLYPFWAPDGTSLFYITSGGDVMKTPVDGTGSTFRAGAPAIFAAVAAPPAGGLHVSLHPDGDRILHVAGEASENESGYLRLVTDWRRGLVK